MRWYGRTGATVSKGVASRQPIIPERTCMATNSTGDRTGAGDPGCIHTQTARPSGRGAWRRLCAFWEGVSHVMGLSSQLPDGILWGGRVLSIRIRAEDGRRVMPASRSEAGLSDASYSAGGIGSGASPTGRACPSPTADVPGAPFASQATFKCAILIPDNHYRPASCDGMGMREPATSGRSERAGSQHGNPSRVRHRPGRAKRKSASRRKFHA